MTLINVKYNTALNDVKYKYRWCHFVCWYLLKAAQFSTAHLWGACTFILFIYWYLMYVLSVSYSNMASRGCINNSNSFVTSVVDTLPKNDNRT